MNRSSIGLAGALAVLGIAVAACGPSTTSHSTDTANNAPAATAAAVPSQEPTTPAAPAQPTYTVAQQQAIASAEDYLNSGQGFSKLGLIDQLHSHYGEGFSKKLAQFAVAHVRVNWKHQAVISAKSYMKTEPGWSYSGLVDQLSSSAGENFTLAQAQYAAHAVGL